MVTKTSIKKAIKEARGCSQGNLYLEDNKVFFYMGNDTGSELLIKDFWNVVQNNNAYDAAQIIETEVLQRIFDRR